MRIWENFSAGLKQYAQQRLERAVLPPNSFSQFPSPSFSIDDILTKLNTCPIGEYTQLVNTLSWLSRWELYELEFERRREEYLSRNRVKLSEGIIPFSLAVDPELSICRRSLTDPLWDSLVGEVTHRDTGIFVNYRFRDWVAHTFGFESDRKLHAYIKRVYPKVPNFWNDRLPCVYVYWGIFGQIIDPIDFEMTLTSGREEKKIFF